MQISTLVRRFISIFLKYLFACELSFTFCDWHSGLFDYKYCCNTPHVNAHQLGLLTVVHGHMTLYHYRLKIHGDRVSFYRMIHGPPWHVDHSIVMNIMWRHFDQSPKQLIVCHTTVYRWCTVVSGHSNMMNPTLKMSHKGTARVRHF